MTDFSPRAYRHRSASPLILARLSGVGLLALSLLSLACDPSTPTAAVDGQPAAPDAMPVPGRHLDQSSPINEGLLLSVVADGLPALVGAGIDPRIIEARRFYDTVQYPNAQPQPVSYPNPFTGAMEATRATAPLTIEAWKTAFGFSPRAANETLDAYRLRTGIVVYYNRNELGLGRELGCTTFVDGQDAAGKALEGVACFVTNYGIGFRDEPQSLALAAEGAHPRNTVCITYRPSLPADYQVQFYTYSADGSRQDWAQLDTLGPRPHPEVCMNCHGGVYDSDKHLAKHARFLPLDPNLIGFLDDPSGAPSLGRAAEEERIRAMNALATRTPLTPAQREMLDGLYAGAVATPGQVSASSWAPAAWGGSAHDADLYQKAVKPYCATCHLAIYQKTGDDVLPWYTLFSTPGDFTRFPMSSVICGSFSMPNAQPTMANFWDTTHGGVTIDGTNYPSAADALLAALNVDRTSCADLGSISTCNRGPDPDGLCGGITSGTACNRDTGRCVPDLSAPTATPANAIGFCRMDGSRACPKSSQCQQAASPTPGLESFDGVCLVP